MFAVISCLYLTSNNFTLLQASFSSSGARDDIDINDPEFWQKWAKKADVETDNSKVRMGQFLSISMLFFFSQHLQLRLSNAQICVQISSINL